MRTISLLFDKLQYIKKHLYVGDSNHDMEALIKLLMNQLKDLESLDEYVKQNIASLAQKNDSNERTAAINHLKQLVGKTYNFLSDKIDKFAKIETSDMLSIDKLEEEVKLFYQLDFVAKPISTLTYDGENPTYAEILPKLQVRAAEAYVTYATAINSTDEKKATQTLLKEESSIFNNVLAYEKNGHSWTSLFTKPPKKDKQFYLSISKIHEDISLIDEKALIQSKYQDCRRK